MNRNILGFLLTIVAVGVSVGVLLPKIRAVRAISVEKRAKLTVVSTKEKRTESLRTLAQTFANQQDRINTIISNLPPEPEVPELLLAFETIVRESGITLTSLLPQVDTNQQQVVTSLVGEGDLPAVERLMLSVSQSSRPMSISNVSLTKKEDSNRLAINLTFTIPYIAAQVPSSESEAAPTDELGGP